MRPIEDLVAGKTVALVGNASSMLDSPPPAGEIDAHDVVVRINMGVPGIVPATAVGTKCDLWVTAKHFPQVNRSLFRAILFMKLTKLGDREWALFERERLSIPLVRWPRELADECIRYVQCDPGCGLRMLWWLKKKAEPKSVDLYGFDCWESTSSWSRRKNTPNHNPGQERRMVHQLCSE